MNSEKSCINIAFTPNIVNKFVQDPMHQEIEVVKIYEQGNRDGMHRDMHPSNPDCTVGRVQQDLLSGVEPQLGVLRDRSL